MLKKEHIINMGIVLILMCLTVLNVTAGNSDSLDTARKVSYLTNLEKDIILEMNIARNDPKSYAEKYIKGSAEYPKSDVNECYADMSKRKGMGALSPALGITEASRYHVRDQSKTGAVGHDSSDGKSFSKRIELYGKWSGGIAENISYGSQSARGIIVQLLVDSGVSSKGHRKNILNPDYLIIGIAVGPHKVYRVMCVQDFAVGYMDKDKIVPSAPQLIDSDEIEDDYDDDEYDSDDDYSDDYDSEEDYETSDTGSSDNPIEGSPREIALELLKTYCPSGYTIIDNYTKLPDKIKLSNGVSFTSTKTDFAIYLSGDSEDDVVQSLSTAVHETYHGYSSLCTMLKAPSTASFSDKYLYYSIDLKDEYIFKQTKVFLTKEMAAAFPEALQTSRFSTYIFTDEENLGSQSQGVYGLLEEFYAYYHGTKTSYDLYPYYEKMGFESGDHWLSFFSLMNSDCHAFAEFKLYIIKYLVYAKSKYPDIYKTVLKNTAFKTAFNKMDKIYSKLVEDYLAKKELIKKNLVKSGFKVVFDNKYDYIDSQGVGNFLSSIKLLTDELLKKECSVVIKELKGDENWDF